MSKLKQWATKGGLIREDSDDELGDEDHPWQWIYDEVQTPSKKRKASAMLADGQNIIGAKMGSFTVKIGDAVLLKSPEQGKDWAGLCVLSPKQMRTTMKSSTNS